MRGKLIPHHGAGDFLDIQKSKALNEKSNFKLRRIRVCEQFEARSAISTTPDQIVTLREA